MKANTSPLPSLLAALGLLLAHPVIAEEAIPRTAGGKPDLSGNYDTATLTPLRRPPEYGNNLYLTPEEAEKIQEERRQYLSERSQRSDPNREAPPEGGDGSSGASGNVGGYNAFWVDAGDGANLVDGKFRTSIITDPKNGQFPEMTADARQRMARRFGGGGGRGGNDGSAWWLERGDGSGPYDDPELRGAAERCLLGFGSTQGPPMLPVLYNNHKRIVQTEDHVLILVEMIHDARIVRLGEEHEPPSVRKWLGDSIGWWDGDTLVVDTTNFTDNPGLFFGTRDLHVVERFSRLDAGTLLYEFTVEDPTVWQGSWTGSYAWPRTDEKIYEYACHEGNYALGNVLRGARLLEAEAMAAKESSAGD